MSKFKIEKNVPPPAPRCYLGKYPFKDMKVGDSFFVPEGSNHNLASMRQKAYLAGKHHGMKFSTRYADGGVRVWRIK